MNTCIHYRVCPSGYVLGKLEPQHSSYIDSHWNFRRPGSDLFMEGIIRNGETVAAFDVIDSTKPVAWVIQYPYGEIGHAYTLEEHRRKGLNIFLKRKICKEVMARGNLPAVVSQRDNPVYGQNMALGFIELCQVRDIFNCFGT